MTCWEGASEYNRLIAVDEDPVFEMPSHSSGEDYFLEITALSNQVFHSVAMGNSDHILFDDWAVVENLGDVVAGRSNEFHAPLKRLMIGLGPDKGWQE
jgi:hypothetical protein